MREAHARPTVSGCVCNRMTNVLTSLTQTLSLARRGITDSVSLFAGWLASSFELPRRSAFVVSYCHAGIRNEAEHTPAESIFLPTGKWVLCLHAKSLCVVGICAAGRPYFR